MNTRIPNTNAFAFFIWRAWLSFLVLGAWTILDPRHCCAQGAIYTERSAFTAAIQSITTVTFESLSPDSVSSLGTSPIIDSGVIIANADHRLFVCNFATGIYPIPGDGQYIFNFDSAAPVGIVIPNGMNSFGADFSGGIVPQNNPFNGTITVNLAGGQTYSYNFTGQVGSWTFRGFVFSDLITSLVYNDGGGRLHEEMLDNITFGVAVPEPQTSLLAVFGILTSFGVLRLRSRNSSVCVCRLTSSLQPTAAGLFVSGGLPEIRCSLAWSVPGSPAVVAERDR